MPYPTCDGVCRRCWRAEHLEETVSFCGRVLTASELNLVRQIIADFPRLSQAELAYTICELLEWRRPNGCATQKWQIARIPFLWRVSECLDTLSTRRPPLMPNSLPELLSQESDALNRPPDQRSSHERQPADPLPRSHRHGPDVQLDGRHADPGRDQHHGVAGAGRPWPQER